MTVGTLGSLEIREVILNITRLVTGLKNTTSYYFKALPNLYKLSSFLWMLTETNQKKKKKMRQ